MLYLFCDVNPHHRNGLASPRKEQDLNSFVVREVQRIASLAVIYIRVPPSACLCVLPGVFLSSRVSGACPVTTGSIMRVNVTTTTTTTGSLVRAAHYPVENVKVPPPPPNPSSRILVGCSHTYIMRGSCGH